MQNRSPIWKLKLEFTVKIEIPSIVNKMAKVIDFVGTFLSIMLVIIGTNTTVRLTKNPAFEAGVVLTPNIGNPTDNIRKNP